MEELTTIFKALSDETRLRIIQLLEQGELCVCDIRDVLQVPQSPVSRHLAYLKHVGLVDDRRCGVWTYYSIVDSVPATLPRGRPLEVKFENVSFRYPGREEWALREVSLVLEPGEKLGLVGENGAGKSTLVKLLLRFYDPTEGAVRYGGVDVRDMEVGDLRRRDGRDRQRRKQREPREPSHANPSS